MLRHANTRRETLRHTAELFNLQFLAVGRFPAELSVMLIRVEVLLRLAVTFRITGPGVDVAERSERATLFRLPFVQLIHRLPAQSGSKLFDDLRVFRKQVPSMRNVVGLTFRKFTCQVLRHVF